MWTIKRYKVAEYEKWTRNGILSGDGLIQLQTQKYHQWRKNGRARLREIESDKATDLITFGGYEL